MRSFLVCWLIFVVSIYHVAGQEPKPIMALNEFVSDISNVVSVCKNGLQYLINDVDFFTVRGTVNKNGSNADAYIDTNLYIQTAPDLQNYWASQCGPDLTVCGSNLRKHCYCESKDANGDYHIVMTIMAKSIYSGGKLILSWNDARSPFNTPMLSNQVDYYPGTISERKIVTLKIGSFDRTIDTDPSSNTYKDFRLDYTEDMPSATFCVYNLEANSLIEIKENENSSVQTTRASCLTLDFSDQGPNRVLTMSFTETGECERTGSYILRISPGSDCVLEYYQIAIIVIIFSLWVVIVITIIIMLCYKCINNLTEVRQILFMVIVCCLWAVSSVFLFILLGIKQTSKPECGFEDYKIALIVVMSALTLIGVILVLVFYLKYNKRKNNGNFGSSSQETGMPGTLTTKPNASTRI